jgi:hypothetical protein
MGSGNGGQRERASRRLERIQSEGPEFHADNVGFGIGWSSMRPIGFVTDVLSRGLGIAVGRPCNWRDGDCEGRQYG